MKELGLVHPLGQFGSEARSRRLTLRVGLGVKRPTRRVSLRVAHPGLTERMNESVWRFQISQVELGL